MTPAVQRMFAAFNPATVGQLEKFVADGFHADIRPHLDPQPGQLLDRLDREPFRELA